MWADIVKNGVTSVSAGGASAGGVSAGSASAGGACNVNSNIVVLSYDNLYESNDRRTVKANEILYFDEETDPDSNKLLVSDKKTFIKAEIAVVWRVTYDYGRKVRCCDRDFNPLVEKAELVYEYQNKKDKVVILKYACDIDFKNKKISVTKK